MCAVAAGVIFLSCACVFELVDFDLGPSDFFVFFMLFSSAIICVNGRIFTKAENNNKLNRSGHNIFNKLYRQLFYVNFRDPNIAFAEKV